MKKRDYMTLLSLAVCVGAVPLAAGASTPPTTGTPGPVASSQTLEALQGKIRQVDDESFVLMVGETAHTVSLSESTKYYLDGKEARRNDVLKVGQEVRVEVTDGAASSVSARSGS